MISLDKTITRSPKKILRVKFTDGTIFCYKNATTTFVETLRKIGTDRLQSITLSIRHLPIISKECYPQFQGYMKPLGNGWYVNTQSDTSQKYIQLDSIKNSLGLDYEVEIGEDIIPDSKKLYTKSRQHSDNILIKLPDGTFLGRQSGKETYIETIKYLGIEKIRQKSLEIMGKECVTRFKKYPNQEQIDNSHWITIPNSTKDKMRALESLSLRLKANLTITLI